MSKPVKLFNSMSVPATIPVDPGRSLIPTYREVKPDHAPSYLEQIGETDMDAQIQSFSNSVDLAHKIAQYQSGDLDALRSAEGMFLDLSQAPKNLAQAMKISMSISENYDSLPDDVKSVFGSLDAFKKSVFDRTFDSKLAAAFASKDVVQKEVSADDTE